VTTGTRTTFQAALDKAAERGGLLLVRRELGRGRYEVRGSHGRVYIVTVADGEYACTCTAGQLGRPCYHQGAVAMLRAAQSAAGIAPAAPRESDATLRARLLAESRARTRHIEELEGSLADCFTTAA